MSEPIDPSAEPGDEIASMRIEDAGVDLLGTGTAQVEIPLLVEREEDDLVDDDVPPNVEDGFDDAEAVEATDETASADGVDDVIAATDAEPETDGESDADADIDAPSQPVVAPTAPAPVLLHEPVAAATVAAAVTVAPASTVPAQALRRHSVETAPVDLASKRAGEREAQRESADLLTGERLVAPGRLPKPEPEGAWPHFLYTISGRRINLGDSAAARARKVLDARIAAHLPGGARFVPVLARKGGVGKTTVTTLLGMALADAREDRVIAIDANPDRGTLADRIGADAGKTVRDLSRAGLTVDGFNEFSGMVARDHTRLDILASDTDPHVSDAFSDADYREVAQLAAHYYSIVLTDTGTGIVHSVMSAALEAADALVIVAGLSVDEARLASETITWLEANGYSDAAHDAVVVVNTSRTGAALVRADEVEEHFRSRVRRVLRLPYDPLIATGGAISFRELQPATREAARQLAATVLEGLTAPMAAR